MAGPFKLKSGNTPLFKTMGSSPLKEQPQTQRAKYTRARQSRAFGEGVSAREGAKLLRTSTWKYNKMKKDWLRSQKKKDKKVVKKEVIKKEKKVIKKEKEAVISAEPPVVTDVIGGTGSDWMVGKTGNIIRIGKIPPKT